MHSFGSAGGSIAQAPVASMNSTSRGITSTAATASVSVPQVACISTSASYIRGGVTTTQTYTPNGRIKRDPLPGGNPEGCECDWQWDPIRNGWVCTICGEFISKDDYYDLVEGESPHGTDPCPCAVPIGDGVEVYLFIAALAGVYALYKARARKEQLI